MASEEKFIDRTRSEIDKLLNKHHLEIESEQVAKISTMPALLSLLMRSKDDIERIEAASRLDRNFNFLIPDDIAKNLPRNPAKWSLAECDRVASAIWVVSYGEELERLLTGNIHANLTDLIFLPIIQEFEQALCLKISEWADKRIENRIGLKSINYVKTQSERLLNRIDRAVYISINFKWIPNLFKGWVIYWLSWVDNFFLIFSSRGNS